MIFESPSRFKGPLVFFYIFILLILASCGRPPIPSPPVPPVIPPPIEPLQSVTWQDVPDWNSEDLRPALQTFIISSPSLKRDPQWQAVCDEALQVNATDEEAVRRFFETRFVPHRVNNSDGTDRGVITGYYVPDLQGSRTPDESYRYPVLAVPDDLLIVELGALYPDLKGRRLRGRLEGRKVVPYWSRAEIDTGQAPVEGKELFWVKDPVDLFFLHIQGSGRISTEDGERVMVNYADQNGHPYRSIGRLLLESGAMTRDQMSAQNIKAWGRRNPDKVMKLLGENPSYVFFRSAEQDLTSPPGALGYPLTPERSLAVDPTTIPLGAPVFIATTWPNSQSPLHRLMVAQDTGGAIKGAVRADFFWGLGNEAGAKAGRMKQDGRLWVLLPRAD
ncbi:transglycosylase [Syntrophotalea acetylenivorans]|uniref:peptidoglycan lytic exotransglycosylase n=1 Tax=Syntrophotalea acetylenivorans TaxID=1842532 RepID=A0A1L3GLW0_9BACT|nr:transglycosylase [Syntrophotalea acetylenivorans]